jgi:pyridoxamine 5'-phosphate oxidase
VRHARPLLESEVSTDPLEQFGAWFAQAAAALEQPEAAALATASEEGRPSVRMVLVKSWSQQGFVFYSNYESRKGKELAANPYGALAFYWAPLGRQVRLEGPVSKLDPAASDAYFATRPLGARVSAAVSRQSQPVASREALESAARALLSQASGDHGPSRPPWWGGYVLRPETYEFWQHREDRLHDRLAYRQDGGAWRIQRLQP